MFREALALYGSTTGSATARALREEPTARGAVEAMLRGNIDIFADTGTPSGCMIVLAAANCSYQNRGVAEHLAGHRRRTVAELEDRLERAITEGELAPETDVRSVADFYATILYGLSIEARDGVHRGAAPLHGGPGRRPLGHPGATGGPRSHERGRNRI
ncbi:TetR family transcriptional regulator C-terminal domain-containing protein [Streptomyces rubiginosohelvolus]|uniref:TetR family transcriptional regulator C-terminal domain-containing protein n=1 Tax=Streptomyces rubiginosohelvolus TaxID=67362 RepID=UPI0037F1106D